MLQQLDRLGVPASVQHVRRQGYQPRHGYRSQIAQLKSLLHIVEQLIVVTQTGMDVGPMDELVDVRGYKLFQHFLGFLATVDVAPHHGE